MTTEKNIQPDAIRWTDDMIIDLIRKLRNDLIKDFLDERNLMSYFAERFNNKDLSATKIEFLKKDLKELLITPVDVSHYAVLIEQIRSTNTASLASHNEELFYKELDSIFRKYNY